MPFYMVEFNPPPEYSDLESIVACVLAEREDGAIIDARECLEAEWGETLALRDWHPRVIDEDEYFGWWPCSVHYEVRI